MPLEPGTALGPYSITAKIGEGGMGEVWQARDTKLDRDVALKVLPEAFTSDPDRLARFEREAKVPASLNHPNIGSIYGLEEAEGVRLVEGPTRRCCADPTWATRSPQVRPVTNRCGTTLASQARSSGSGCCRQGPPRSLARPDCALEGRCR